MPREGFEDKEIEDAWIRDDGKCECCGKELLYENRGDSGKGSWEAHHGDDRLEPVILCTEEPENCHLNCGHEGDWRNPGITPRFHRGR